MTKMILFILITVVQSVTFAKSVKVIVLDSGTPQVKSFESKYITKSQDFTKTSHYDTDGHGTHIISLITDRGNIPAERLRIVSMKVFDKDGTNLLPYLNALKEAIKEKPDIINISYVHAEAMIWENIF